MDNYNQKVDGTDLNKFAARIHFVLWLLILLFIGRTVLLPAIIAGDSFGFIKGTDETIMIDFATHFNHAKEIWKSAGIEHQDNSIYSVSRHLQSIRTWAGSDSPYSLSFGYSPTMLWLLAPLVLLPHGYAFVLFDLASLLSIWWQTTPSRSRLGIAILAFMSPLAYGCLQIGQTALFTGGCLLYLAESSCIKADTGQNRRAILSALALWILTAKPPIAVTAGAAMMAIGKWRPLLIATIITIASTLLVWPLLGPGWVSEYVDLVSRYNLVDADRAFAWSHHPEHMANLRALLSVDFRFSDDIACKISMIVWGAALLWLTTMGRLLKFPPHAYWALALIFYLLFCPHVSSTEEIQLLILIPLCIPIAKTKLEPHETVFFALVLLAPFISPACGPFLFDVRMGLFFVKIFFMLLIMYNFYKRREYHQIQSN